MIDEWFSRFDRAQRKTLLNDLHTARSTVSDIRSKATIELFLHQLEALHDEIKYGPAQPKAPEVQVVTVWDRLREESGVRSTDSVIGRLDRMLSEFLELAKGQLDEPDRQTVKHHADDLIGVGQAVLALVVRTEKI